MPYLLAVRVSQHAELRSFTRIKATTTHVSVLRSRVCLRSAQSEESPSDVMQLMQLQSQAECDEGTMRSIQGRQVSEVRVRTLPACIKLSSSRHHAERIYRREKDVLELGTSHNGTR